MRSCWLLIGLLILAVAIAPAAFAQDATPPELVAFDMTPPVLNIVVADIDGDSGSSGNPLTVTVPATANLNSGQASYKVGCAACHNTDGTGGIGPPALTNITPYDPATGNGYSFDSLTAKIHATMPPLPFSSSACEDDCAEDTAALILCSFNPMVAEGCSDAATGIVVPATADLTAGQSRYASQCQGCHRADGMGPTNRNLTDIVPYRSNPAKGYTFDSLTAKIRDTMPKTSPPACVGDCAVNTAAHILCELVPDSAEGCP
ncbi:MAG: c-type cytochrome [Myxococcota bacterium]